MIPRALIRSTKSLGRSHTWICSSSAAQCARLSTTTKAEPEQVMKFTDWLANIKDTLKPPVANKLLFEKALKVMVVGGPNVRKDFHVQDGEELFWQLQGDVAVRIEQDGVFKDISIPEGHVFLLPRCIPHSPQRPANTIGFVFERERSLREIDSMRWYQESHSDILYEENFHCFDLGAQLGPVIERFQASDSAKTGRPVKKSFDVGDEVALPHNQRLLSQYPHEKNGQNGVPYLPLGEAFDLHDWIDANANIPGKHTIFDGEFVMMVVTGSHRIDQGDWLPEVEEAFLKQISGTSTLRNGERTIEIAEGEIILLNDPHSWEVDVSEDASKAIVVTNKVAKALPTAQFEWSVAQASVRAVS